MTNKIRKMYFPYCLQKQKDGSWIFLNRKYKPIGFNTGDCIDYEEYPVSMKIPEISHEVLKSSRGKI